MTYLIIHETDLLRFQASRTGDVIMTRKPDGKEVYFQTGDAGSAVLDILDESPPDIALHILFDEYFV